MYVFNSWSVINTKLPAIKGFFVIKIPRIQEISIELDSQNIWEGIKKKKGREFYFCAYDNKSAFFYVPIAIRKVQLNNDCSFKIFQPEIHSRIQC